MKSGSSILAVIRGEIRRSSDAPQKEYVKEGTRNGFPKLSNSKNESCQNQWQTSELSVFSTLPTHGYQPTLYSPCVQNNVARPLSNIYGGPVLRLSWACSDLYILTPGPTLLRHSSMESLSDYDCLFLFADLNMSNLFLRRIISSIAFNALHPNNFWERPKPRPRQVVFVLAPVQAMPQPDTPSYVEVGTRAGHKMPTIVR